MRTLCPLFITLSLLLAASARGAEPAPRNLSDPAWWFTRAQNELRSVADPEEQSLIGSMISGAQGSLAPPEDLPKTLEQRFASRRSALGEDADWQFALFAGHQYEAHGRFGESIEAFASGRKLVDRISDAAKRKRLYYDFDFGLGSVISSAASQGDVLFALEAVALHQDRERDTVLDQIAYKAAKIDLDTAIRTTTKLSPTATPREWRLLLLVHCRGGKAEHYERAIRQFVQDRAAMEALDVRRCYIALTNALESLPREVKPGVLDSLKEQLSRDITLGAKENDRGEASKCLATLHLAQGDLDAANRVTDQRGQPLLRGDFGSKAATLLVAQGKHEQAVALSSLALYEIAAVQTKVGQLDEALETIARFEKRDAGNAGYAAEVARKFAERDDWRGVERALALIEDHQSWMHCLAEIAAIAHKRGQSGQVAALLRQGTSRLEKIGDASSRESAAQGLALAYLAVGDTRTAWLTIAQHGGDFERAMFLTKMAEHQLDSKDAAGFRASMDRLTAVVARDQLHLERDELPSVEPSPWRGPRQICFSLMIGRLYLRAGDRPRAEAAIKSGFARAGNTPGSVWRADVYFEMLEEKPTLQTLGEVADLQELVPTATDRAMLALLGGMLAAQQQKEAR